MDENPKLNSEHMLSGEIKLLLMKPFLFLKSHQPKTSFHQKSSQTKHKLRQIPKNMTHRIDLTKAVTDRDKTMIRVISPEVVSIPESERTVPGLMARIHEYGRPRLMTRVLGDYLILADFG